MSLDDSIARHNSDIFVREFTYRSSVFKTKDGQEHELCDGAVWIGDLLILLQNKERNPSFDKGDPTEEARWFSKKVSKEAVNQLNDSVQFLQKEQSLPLANLRGQMIDMTKTKEMVSLTHLIALYSPSKALPLDLLMKKGRVSKRVGFVHFLTCNDYVSICNTLHTPFEVSDYLTFRKDISLQNADADKVTEKAILGQFLFNPDSSRPVSARNRHFVDRLTNDVDKFSLANLLAVYLDRVYLGGEDTNYHAILVELAKLRRNTALEFRKRLTWAMDVCKRGENLGPSRFYPGLSKCPFIFIPLDASRRGDWQLHLMPLTALCKHDFKSPKCIGLTVAPDPHDSRYYLLNWNYIEFPWEPDLRADALIRETKPFREATGKMVASYTFDQR
jgi:hypothetical protein